MRILYCGVLRPGSTSLMRMRAFEGMGHEVSAVATIPDVLPSGVMNVAWRAGFRLRRPLDLTGANARVVGLARESSFDLLWIDRGLTLWPSTLRAFRQLQPRARVAGYSPDDMGSSHNQSSFFLHGLSYHDAYFTTKTYGVAELHALGVPNVFFNGNAYDPETHRPVELSAADRQRYQTDVGFVGAFEEDRAQHILHLEQNGVCVRVLGETRWLEFWGKHTQMSRPQPPVWGLEYTKALCGAAINLCFLRKINRDLQTQRSVEIPACGGFMLAERTDEHRALFEEGKEAEYFSSKGELLEKVRFYLTNSEARARIAAAGLERCNASGYSYPERMRQALAQLGQLPPRP
jgi:hypothetical protein